jgi:hypothetical protein
LAGVKTPMLSALYMAPDAIILMRSPFTSRPSTTRTSMTTPT